MRINVPHGLLSQVLASGTNFLLLVTLARSQSVDSFGWSALTIAVVTAAVGVSRSVFGTSIALASGSAPHLRTEGRFGGTASALATTLLMTPVIVWALGREDWQIAMVALGAPFIVFQDTLRQVCFSSGSAHLALKADLVRIILVALPAAGTSVATFPSFLSIGVWWGSAFVTALYLAMRLGWKPYSRSLLAHWRHTAGQRFSLLGDSLLIQLTPVANSLLIGSALSAVALSAFRGGSTLLGPVSILLTAVPLLMMPRIVREGSPTFAHAMRRLRPINLGLSAACIVIAACTPLVPAHVGELVLGESWLPTQAILPLLAIQFAIQPWALSVTTGLKLIGRSHVLVPLRVARSVGLIVVVTVALRSESITTVVASILAFEALATLGYLAVGRRYRAKQIHSARSIHESSIGEA